MKKNILCFVFALAAIVSCNMQSALSFNDNLVGKENKLSEKMNTIQNNLNSYVENKNYDSISAVAGRIMNEIDNTISDVSKVSVPNLPEADNFKNGYIRYYKAIRSVYAAYKDYGTAPEADKENALNKVNELGGKLSQVLSNFHTLQEKFTDANNLRLQK